MFLVWGRSLKYKTESVTGLALEEFLVSERERTDRLKKKKSVCHKVNAVPEDQEGRTQETGQLIGLGVSEEVFSGASFEG